MERASRWEESDHEFFGRKSEYDLTKKPARLRAFADNYQFHESTISSRVPVQAVISEFNEQTSQTRLDSQPTRFMGSHQGPRQRIIESISSSSPGTILIRPQRRQTVHNLRLPTGTLALFEHPNNVKFRVPPGDYMIYCRAYNLGAEGDAMSDLPDDEFFKHDEWERYELILVPGVADREGTAVKKWRSSRLQPARSRLLGRVPGAVSALVWSAFPMPRLAMINAERITEALRNQRP